MIPPHLSTPLPTPQKGWAEATSKSDFCFMRRLRLRTLGPLRQNGWEGDSVCYYRQVWSPSTFFSSYCGILILTTSVKKISVYSSDETQSTKQVYNQNSQFSGFSETEQEFFPPMIVRFHYSPVCCVLKIEAPSWEKCHSLQDSWTCYCIYCVGFYLIPHNSLLGLPVGRLGLSDAMQFAQ